MGKEAVKPIYFLGLNPAGWKKDNFPRMQQASSIAPNFLEGISLAEQQQKQQWKEVTGVDPHNSNLSIIIPLMSLNISHPFSVH